jgi:hypothetical protein
MVDLDELVLLVPARGAARMSPADRKPVVYLLRLRSLRGEDIHALRPILKALLRRYGWRCVSVEQERRL